MKNLLVKLRPGVAMIELIFALVIMAIVLMSAPQLISTASKSGAFVLQQEALNEAVSRVSMVLTYPWDENDTMDTCIPPVLNVSANGDAELALSANVRRIGVPTGSASHTFHCLGNTFAATPQAALGPEGDKDDIDDFTGNVSLTLVADLATGKDYLEDNVNINTAVNYVRDAATYNSAAISYNFNNAAAAGSTNIKAITVTLTSTLADAEYAKNIVLKAFSCNLGGIEYESRTF